MNLTAITMTGIICLTLIIIAAMGNKGKKDKDKKSGVKMELTSDELEDIINRAAAAGAQAAYAQAKKQGKEKTDRYNDTFAVMKNYKDARFYLDHTVDAATKLNTSLKLQHIDAALKVMEQRRASQNRAIEYEAFKLYFLEGLNYETIAEKLETSKNTPRRWVTGILSELSTLFWGLDNDL